jgi:hypothetical protein
MEVLYVEAVMPVLYENEMKIKLCQIDEKLAEITF